MSISPANFGTEFIPVSNISFPLYAGPFFTNIDGPLYIPYMAFASPSTTLIKMIKSIPNSNPIGNNWQEVAIGQGPTFPGPYGPRSNYIYFLNAGNNIYCFFPFDGPTSAQIGIWKFSMVTELWTNLHYPSPSFVIETLNNGADFLSYGTAPNLGLRAHYLSNNKLFIVYVSSFSDVFGNNNDGIYYKIFNLDTNGFDSSGNISLPPVNAAFSNRLAQTAIDEINSRILIIFAEHPDTIINNGPFWKYIILDYLGSKLNTTVIGNNLGFHYNAPGETLYIKYVNPPTPIDPLYNGKGVFGKPKAVLDDGVIKFLCPYKGTKLRLHLLLIDSLVGTYTLNVIDNTDYICRISGNLGWSFYDYINSGHSLGIVNLGTERAIFWFHFDISVGVRIAIKRRLGNNTWSNTEFITTSLTTAEEETLNIESYGENVDRFFGVMNGSYFGPLTSGSGIQNLLRIFADAMFMFDSIALRVDLASGQPPIVIVPKGGCPDIEVNSSYCSAIKLVDDSSPNEVNCQEKIFIESSPSC